MKITRMEHHPTHNSSQLLVTSRVLIMPPQKSTYIVYRFFAAVFLLKETTSEFVPWSTCVTKTCRHFQHDLPLRFLVVRRRRQYPFAQTTMHRVCIIPTSVICSAPMPAFDALKHAGVMLCLNHTGGWVPFTRSSKAPAQIPATYVSEPTCPKVLEGFSFHTYICPYAPTDVLRQPSSRLLLETESCIVSDHNLVALSVNEIHSFILHLLPTLIN